jgi:hypothetical protein
MRLTTILPWTVLSLLAACSSSGTPVPIESTSSQSEALMDTSSSAPDRQDEGEHRDRGRHAFKHVLLLSIDGLHQSDLAKFIQSNPSAALAKLARRGIQYTNAYVNRLERISQPPQEEDDATQLEEGEEICGLVLEASDEPTRTLKPREEAFDVPASSVAAQCSTVLSSFSAQRVVRRDHLDSEFAEFGVQTVAVVGTIADEAFRKRLQEPSAERFEDELRFMSLTTRNPDGDRKTMAVCHCHDLGRLAASSFANKSAPFFAPAWLPSMKASVRSSFPRS